MIPWWTLILALMFGWSLGAILWSVIAAAHSCPTLSGQWRGTNSGIEFTIAEDGIAWFSRTKSGAEGFGQRERAWKVERESTPSGEEARLG